MHYRKTECRFYISELYIYVALVRSQIIGAQYIDQQQSQH